MKRGLLLLLLFLLASLATTSAQKLSAGIVGGLVVAIAFMQGLS